MFVAFSFVSAVDLIIALEEDGLISGFTELYVREVPTPHPPHGAPAPPDTRVTDPLCPSPVCPLPV